jgi:chromosome segregation ATPase
MQLIAQMKSNMSSLKEQRDVENSRANVAEHRMMEMIKASAELQQKKAEVEERVINLEKQNKALIAELKKAQQTINETREGKASLNSRVEQLEKEKVALVLEQIDHVKEIDSLHELVEAADDNITELKAKIEEEIKQKQEILSSRMYQDNDIQKLKDDILELEEHIASLKKELKESESVKNEFQDIYRTQQLENTARINEYAEKNSAQADEIMRLKEEVQGLAVSKSSDLMHWDAQRSELSSQLTASKQKVSSLSDEVEEYLAKLESCRAEVADLRERLKQASNKQEERIEQLNDEHTRQTDKLKSQMKAEFDVEIEKLKSSYQQTAEEKYRNVMFAAKEANDKRTAQFNARINDLTNELNDVKAALNASEIAQKNESDKVNQSLQQIKDIRRFSEENASKLQDRIRALEKEKAMLITKYTAEFDDLNEQVVALNDSIKRKDNNIELFRQQINSEKETRFTLSQRLLELEDFQSKTKMQERTEMQKLQSFQEQIRSLEQKCESIRKEKDVEIDRLQRRNEMLSETVTRLTSLTKESTISSSSPRTQRPYDSQTPSASVAAYPAVSQDKVMKVTTSSNDQDSVNQIRTPTSTATLEEKRKMFRSAVPSVNAMPSENLASSSQPSSPNHRMAMSQQVNSAINKVQEAIDRRKMKALESAVPLDLSMNESGSPLKISTSLKLLKADIESTTPKSKLEIISASSSPSRRDLDKSFTDKLRETVTASKDYEVNPHNEDASIDIHEEY